MAVLAVYNLTICCTNAATLDRGQVQHMTHLSWFPPSMHTRVCQPMQQTTWLQPKHSTPTSTLGAYPSQFPQQQEPNSQPALLQSQACPQISMGCYRTTTVGTLMALSVPTHPRSCKLFFSFHPPYIFPLCFASCVMLKYWKSPCLLFSLFLCKQCIILK
jgi:hypothetical protein